MIDLDSPQPIRIRPPPVHAALTPYGAPIAGLARQRAHRAVLIRERIGERRHVAAEEIGKHPARSLQLIERARRIDLRERRVRHAVRAELHSVHLQRANAIGLDDDCAIRSHGPALDIDHVDVRDRDL